MYVTQIVRAVIAAIANPDFLKKCRKGRYTAATSRNS
jgi:hypothetical protein